MRAAIAIGWGVKSGGERMAVGAGGAVLIPAEVRHRAAGGGHERTPRDVSGRSMGHT
jgi:hypothetical protein